MAQQSKQTIKQERDARRLEKVEAFKKEQARQRRNRRLGIGGAVVGGLLVVGLVVTAVVATYTPAPNPDDIVIEGVQNFGTLPATHVTEEVDYEALYDMNPPAGGNHAGAWLNCGVYEQEQPAVAAVHSLEHGAIWVTYDPEVVTGADLDTLRGKLPSTYVILSPYPGLPAPVVLSAWANQLKLDGVDDERLQPFFDKFWKSPNVPEPGASCTGAYEGTGRVS